MIYEFARKCELGYSRKNADKGVELRTLSVRGYWKKSMRKFQGSVKIEMEFQSVFTKNSWNFHGSWFLTLEFPRGVTQYCRISKDKVTNVKKVYPHLLLLYSFWNSPLVLRALHPPSTQDVNWTYIRRLEDVQDVLWRSYVRSIYVLCLLGLGNYILICICFSGFWLQK